MKRVKISFEESLGKQASTLQLTLSVVCFYLTSIFIIFHRGAKPDSVSKLHDRLSKAKSLRIEDFFEGKQST